VIADKPRPISGHYPEPIANSTFHLLLWHHRRLPKGIVQDPSSRALPLGVLEPQVDNGGFKRKTASCAGHRPPPLFFLIFFFKNGNLAHELPFLLREQRMHVMPSFELGGFISRKLD